MWTVIDRSLKIYYINIKFVMQKKYAENYSIIVSFLHQTYKFIRKRAMTGQKFRQWSDDIKPEDDITPFDGTFSKTTRLIALIFLLCFCR